MKKLKRRVLTSSTVILLIVVVSLAIIPMVIGGRIPLPKYEGYIIDPYNVRAIIIHFSYTNPLNYPFTVNSLTGDVICNKHSYPLGEFVLLDPPVVLPYNTKVDFYVRFTWTEAAEDHFMSMHPRQRTISISLTNIEAGVSGITVKVPISYNVGNIPLPEFS